MREMRQIRSTQPLAEPLWASRPELLNLSQTDKIGCHTTTVKNDVLAKLQLGGKDLDRHSGNGDGIVRGRESG
jgi:hypothetical protein